MDISLCERPAHVDDDPCDDWSGHDIPRTREKNEHRKDDARRDGQKSEHASSVVSYGSLRVLRRR